MKQQDQISLMQADKSKPPWRIRFTSWKWWVYGDAHSQHLGKVHMGLYTHVGIAMMFCVVIAFNPWVATWINLGSAAFDQLQVEDGTIYSTYGKDPYVIFKTRDEHTLEMEFSDRSTTYFELDADGYKERTAWVDVDDGQVTQTKEIAYGELPTEKDTDLHALAKVFADRGARFSEFRIWKGANINGVADAGEMVTLQAEGSAANDALYWRCA